MAQELRQAVQDCRIRALYASAKWAAAALLGLPEQEVQTAAGGDSVAASSSSDRSAAYELARSLFDLKVGLNTCSAPPVSCSTCPNPQTTGALYASHACPQEYRGAAYALRDSKDSLSLFLRGYATYLAGEKRMQ
jgi:anaphase-promoting complex subunit 8